MICCGVTVTCDEETETVVACGCDCCGCCCCGASDVGNCDVLVTGWGWMFAILSGQNLCTGLVCGLFFFTLDRSGLLASSMGWSILLRAFINLCKRR